MQIVLWILAALSVLAAGWLTYRSDVRKAVPYPWLTAALRALAIALAWALVLAPEISRTKQETQQPVVVLLDDESQSIPATLGSDTGSYRKDYDALAARLSKDFRVVRWGFGNGVSTDSLFRYRQGATDITNALSRVTELFGQQNLGSVVLATDGRFNQGTHPLFAPLPLRASLYTVVLGDTAAPRDVRIPQVYANRTVTKGSQFEIRADVLGLNVPGYNGAISLTENGARLQQQPVSISAARYDRSFSFSVTAGAAGLHHYVLSLPAADGEPNVANNRRDVFVEVVDQKQKVLIAAAAPHPDVNAIREALEGLDKFSVMVQTTGEIPATDGYDVVILHGLPAQGGAASLAGLKRPLWVIVAKSTNAAALAEAGLPATLNISPAAVRDAYAAPSAAFTAFTLPQRTGAVTDRLPPLSAAGGTVTPLPDALTLFTERGNSNPLWMIRQGIRPTALTLGEGIWRWRLYEYRYFRSHEVVDECIRQTVSLLAANGADKPFRIELPKYTWSDAEPVTANAFLLNAANENINTPPATLVITDSAGKKQSFSFERNGNAYRLNLGIWAAGSYSYTGSTGYNGRTLTAAGSFVVSGTPLELMETGADYPLLYSLAHKFSGSAVLRPQLGSLYDSIRKNETIRPVIRTYTETAPLVDWKLYFFILLSVLTTEWLLRKYWLAQ